MRFVLGLSDFSPQFAHARINSGAPKFYKVDLVIGVMSFSVSVNRFRQVAKSTGFLLLFFYQVVCLDGFFYPTDDPAML